VTDEYKKTCGTWTADAKVSPRAPDKVRDAAKKKAVDKAAKKKKLRGEARRIATYIAKLPDLLRVTAPPKNNGRSTHLSRLRLLSNLPSGL
jgi:hypothetical protein